MKYPIDYKQVTIKIEFYPDLLNAYADAVAYLREFAWCKKIVNSRIYINLGSTLCVFLFEIENRASRDDNNLWVIVGDVPPMYLDTHGPKTTREVLGDYVKLAEDWIEQVKKGMSIKYCYPFKAEPTLEMAMLLEKRTSFIKNTLIANIDELILPINFTES